MRKNINRDPLRRVIGMEPHFIGDDGETAFYQDWQKLECGHVIRPKEDIYGPAPAAHRRRCAECAKELAKAEATIEKLAPEMDHPAMKIACTAMLMNAPADLAESVILRHAIYIFEKGYEAGQKAKAGGTS